MSPRYQKVWRDLWVARSRILMMLVAITLSLTAVGAVLTGKAINDRELQANYLGTHPASATIEVQGSLNRQILDTVRAQPGVLDAAIRRTLSARIKADESDSWRQLLLFVIPQDDPRRVSTFTVERGVWPPASDELFMERDALGLMDAHVDQSVIVKSPDGTPQVMRIAGAVHDPGLSPATEEDSAYGYISDTALSTLGESAALDQLKLVVGDSFGTPSADRAVIEQTASRVSALLQSQGAQVKDIQIPPPYQHPHQSQMDTLLFMFLIFGAVTLVLSAMLMAGMLSQMLTQQIPQIGMLKVLGAGTAQVLQLYLLMVLVIAGVATAISIPAGVVLGRAFASVIANSQLNFDITSEAVPGWVFGVQIASGIGVPVLVALVPLLQASRITVRAAIDDRGIDETSASGGSLWKWLLTIRWLDRSFLAAVRNVFRRKGRLALSVVLLTMAGAMFTGGINTARALQGATDQGVTIQGYDVEAQLNNPESAQRLETIIGSLDGVARVESWPMLPVATSTDEAGIDLVSTYPDKGHKSFTLEAPPADSQLTHYPLMAGRWLQPDDTNAVVLNQNGKAAFLPRALNVGDTIRLSSYGHGGDFQVVGIVTQQLYPATAFVSEQSFAALTGQHDQAQLVQIVTTQHDTASRQAVLDHVERALADNGVSVRTAFTIAHYQAGVDAHILVLITTLIALASVMGAIGLLGLGSMMSVNVLERTRELGVMQSLGATPSLVRRMVLHEALMISLGSGLLGILLGLPFSIAEGVVIGGMSFNLALGLSVSSIGLLAWAVVASLGAVLATLLPALRASRITIREALAYV